MIKEIKYGGFTANPNDHDSLEGDLAVAMNLIPEDATIKPVLPPGIELSLPPGMKLLAIHDTSSFPGKHYILQDEGNALYWCSGNDSDNVELIIAEFQNVFKLEPIGNTLVTLTDEGMDYFLWKRGGYIYLGKNMPEIKLSFGLIASKQVSTKFQFNEGTYSWKDYIQGNSGNKTMKFSENDKPLYNNILHGKINKMIADEITGKGGFCMPFFVRYAYRLYDESLAMHSAPVLMLPFQLTSMYWNQNDVDIRTYLSLLCYQAIETSVGFDNWKDIITDIEIFVSQPIWTYNAEKDVDCLIDKSHENYMLKSIYSGSNGSVFGEEPDVYAVHEDGFTIYDGRPSIPMYDKNIVLENISNCGLFYHVKTIDIGSLSTERVVLNIRGDYLQSLPTREVMTDDAVGHDVLSAKTAFAFNGRLNLANIIRDTFDGFDPYSCLSYINSEEETTVKAKVEIVTGDKTIVVENTSLLEFGLDKTGVVWFYYPNTSAKRAWITIGDAIYEVELKPHDFLNGAYYFDIDGLQDEVETTPSITADNIIRSANKLYTSEVDNPFLFSSSGINTVGTGDIMEICAAVRPVSTGQMGYADLYIFTDSGIWVAKINEKGTYSNITLATGDVCINPESITQMETSVLFTTDRGIMLISGSQAQCISETIDDDGQQAPGLSEITGLLAPLLGLSVNIKPFREFLGNNKDNGCRMLYDYRGRRIIAYNPSAAFPYAYIYSLESNKWGMMWSNISYAVRAYPDAMAVTQGGMLVNFSETGELSFVDPLSTQLLVTRPLNLDQPDILKTVNTVLQRGLFRKHQEHVQSVLYGSRDLFSWHLVSSSTDEALRGRRGTPFKWFRIGLLLKLDPQESIQGCSIQYDTKYTNRLR